MYIKDLEGLTLEEALDVVLAHYQKDKGAKIKEKLLAAPRSRSQQRRMVVQQTGKVGPDTITALETNYEGINFRSRIEARWAVFLDALGIVWEYEKEGLDLEGTWYLPDFWLPQLELWLEIKGAAPTEREMWKAALLNQITDKKVYIAHGDIPRDVDHYYTDQAPGMLLFDHGCDTDFQYFWSLCRRCLKVGITNGGRSDYLCACGHGHYTSLDERRLYTAYDAARRERFGT